MCCRSDAAAEERFREVTLACAVLVAEAEAEEGGGAAGAGVANDFDYDEWNAAYQTPQLAQILKLAVSGMDPHEVRESNRGIEGLPNSSDRVAHTHTHTHTHASACGRRMIIEGAACTTQIESLLRMRGQHRPPENFGMAPYPSFGNEHAEPSDASCRVWVLGGQRRRGGDGCDALSLPRAHDVYRW